MPSRKKNPQPERHPDGLIRNEHGDVVDPDGNMLPRVFTDIPCRYCQQHANCTRAEKCLGPLAEEPGAGRLSKREANFTAIDEEGNTVRRMPPEGQLKNLHTWQTGGILPDVSSDRPALGESHLPMGGGVNVLIDTTRTALGNVASADLMFGEAADVVHSQLGVLSGLWGENPDNENARMALATLEQADNTGLRVSQMLARCLNELTIFHDGLSE